MITIECHSGLRTPCDGPVTYELPDCAWDGDRRRYPTFSCRAHAAIERAGGERVIELPRVDSVQSYAVSVRTVGLEVTRAIVAQQFGSDEYAAAAEAAYWAYITGVMAD